MTQEVSVLRKGVELRSKNRKLLLLPQKSNQKRKFVKNAIPGMRAYVKITYTIACRVSTMETPIGQLFIVEAPLVTVYREIVTETCGCRKASLDWSQFFSGWLITAWGLTQEFFYHSHYCSSEILSGSVWITQVIQGLWDIMDGRWKYSNVFIHSAKLV